jgi:hypothetical protein
MGALLVSRGAAIGPDWVDFVKTQARNMRKLSRWQATVPEGQERKFERLSTPGACISSARAAAA